MAEELKNNSEAAEVTEDEKKTASKDSKEKKPKNKKPNIFKRFGRYLKDCKSETKKIVWATFPSTVKNTIMVTVTIVICAAAFFGLDKFFNVLITDWLVKLYVNVVL
jgi:preprotein translocase subunit SecE